jgi:hypothetical protein
MSENKRIKITVEGGELKDRQLLTAFFNVSFRKLGAFPQVVTTDALKVMQLGADEWTVGNLIVQLVSTEGAPLISISDGSVEAKAAADEAKANAVLLAAVAASVEDQAENAGTGSK